MQIGFLPLLFVVFLTLKLTEVVALSWWLVFAPLIAMPVLLVAYILLLVAYARTMT